MVKTQKRERITKFFKGEFKATIEDFNYEKIEGKDLFNSAYFLADGKIQEVRHKALLPTYDIFDDSAPLTARAKGYLDVNCAHCHNPQGFASISGLRLGFYVDHTRFEYGICKQPPGWDGGERGLSYDIIPGDGDHSILVYRQELNNAKDRMPPIGRSIAHSDAVALIEKWIDQMEPALGNCQQ